MIKIQLKPSLMKVRRQTVKWIILHHTIELYKQPEAKIDNSILQAPILFNGVLEDKTPDVNYHYVIEKFKNEYFVFNMRPFVYMCEWPDIDPNINNRAIHVAMLGDYSLKIPEPRLYNILAYRILNPFLKIYGLSPSKIMLHSEVSNNKELDCPGEFFNKEIMISKVRSFVIK